MEKKKKKAAGEEKKRKGRSPSPETHLRRPKPTGGKVGVPPTLPGREPPPKNRREVLGRGVKHTQATIFPASVWPAQVTAGQPITSNQSFSSPGTNPSRYPLSAKPTLTGKGPKSTCRSSKTEDAVNF